MAGISKKDQARILNHVEAQGGTITKTKNGHLMRFPNGGTAMLHTTTSDVNATRALRAIFKRNGMTWPFDGDKPTPSYIADQKPRESTLQQYRQALGDPLPDRVHPKEVMLARLKLTKGEDAQLPRNPQWAATYGALHALGYVQTTQYVRGQGRAWELRLEEEPEPQPKKAEPFAPPRMFAVEDEPELAVAEPRPTRSGEREFIDSVESWTLDLARIRDIQVGQLEAVLRAAGLELEIRVWHGTVTGQS